MLNSWWLPTVISACCMGVYDICKKDAVKDNSVMPTLFFTTLCGSVFFVLLALVRGELLTSFACTPKEYFLVLAKSTIVASSWICVYYAMRELPISLASPIRSTSPVWTMLGGILLFGEVPNWLQAIGIVLIFAGYFLFTKLGKLEGFSWKSRGMQLIILGTLLGAASALYDKFLLNTMELNRQMMQMYFQLIWSSCWADSPFCAIYSATGTPLCGSGASRRPAY